MAFDTEVPWFPTDSILFEKGENLALPPGEYESWKQHGFTVLEVGAGTNASTFQSIAKDGINIICIEPGINYRGGNNRYKELRSNPNLSQRIAPLNAVDAIDHPLMPPEGIDVVFAEGPNFAWYAKSRAEFFAQLHGLIRCLKKSNKESYLTFESVYSDLSFNIRGADENIDLPQILTSLGARWLTRENKYGVKYVVIYRTNTQGQDITDRLEELIKAKKN